jgi:hypothetical protein
MATTMRWAAAVGMLAAVGLLVLMLVVEVRPT